MNTALIGEIVETVLDAKGKKFDVDNYFAVRGRLWDPKTQDHTIEISAEIGLRRFRDLSDAMPCYDKLRHADFPGGANADINLELIHFRFGIPHVLKSRILFP